MAAGRYPRAMSNVKEKSEKARIARRAGMADPGRSRHGAKPPGDEAWDHYFRVASIALKRLST